MRNIKVEDGIWEKLMKMKIESRKRTVSDVIKELIKDKISMRKIAATIKQIEQGKSVKKHKGCIGFKVGNKYLQLIN